MTDSPIIRDTIIRCCRCRAVQPPLHNAVQLGCFACGRFPVMFTGRDDGREFQDAIAREAIRMYDELNARHPAS